MTDRRTTPATDMVALERVRHEISRPAYTQGRPARIAVPVADLRAAPDGARDRQLIFGQQVTVIDDTPGRMPWVFIETESGYCGWLLSAQLAPPLTPTHRVGALATHLYPAPDLKTEALARLTMNCAVTVTGVENNFARLACGRYLPAQHITDLPETNAIAVARRFVGTPYLWGGNSSDGIDCSGLVQAAAFACGRPCPADSDLQRAAFPEAEGPPQRGDLIFWKGHVAMAVDTTTLIHANAHAMAVGLEGIEAAMHRISLEAGEGTYLGLARPGWPVG